MEVAGRDERERELRDKAGWYFGAGVPLVWIVLPESREVVVLTHEGARRYGVGERLPSDPHLPGLVPAVDEFFGPLTSAERKALADMLTRLIVAAQAKLT